MSISHPESYQIVDPNTSYISYNGFQNNLTLSFSYSDSNTYIPIPNLYHQLDNNDSPYYFNFIDLHQYSYTILQAILTESNTNIVFNSSPFYLMGINITTPNNITYTNPSIIQIDWNNYNYNGSNTLYIDSQNISNITQIPYNLNLTNYTEGLYNITIVNDLFPNQIYDTIFINLVFSTTSIAHLLLLAHLLPLAHLLLPAHLLPLAHLLLAHLLL